MILRLLLASALCAAPAFAVEYQVGKEGPGIVFPYDAETKTGIDWQTASTSKRIVLDPAKPALDAAAYLQEAIRRMTGHEPAIANGTAASPGILLMQYADAPAEIRDDPKIAAALRPSAQEPYRHVEAFYLRSEPHRLLIIANTPFGLSHGVAELLESVGYEVLGMGPNWTHVPDYRSKPLVFDIDRSGRPGLYNRNLWATSAQDRGNGTLETVFDPADESVRKSYLRWRIGTRTLGWSIPPAGGHAMQRYHRQVADRMIAENREDGFMTPGTHLGPDATRPPASAETKGHLWINTDAPPASEAERVYISDGTKWALQGPKEYRAGCDLTVPWVREIVLEDLKTRSTKHFAENPDRPFIFGADPEDGGGYAEFALLRKNPGWYPEYLEKEGLPFGKPYPLHGFLGLDQPHEIWDPNAPSDTVFGFANWLGHEYDKWLATLPPEERTTATGRDKKSLLTLGLLSYNYYDVPPNFTLDPRIRVKISAFPKHRGSGKWLHYVSRNDLAGAFKRLLPNQPSDTGWYFSNARHSDHVLESIRNGSTGPSAIQSAVAEAYEAGFRGIGAEMDFNFGRLGVAYYLNSKMFWNPRLTAPELAALHERWLQRAYGSGWEEMRRYYQMMEPEGFVNAPNTWAKAIRIIEAADQKIDPAREPAAQRRIDDLKQYWYFYYLVDTGNARPEEPRFREFLWKGQMSYMTPMYMVVRQFFDKKKRISQALGEEFKGMRAHFTPQETQAWWQEILAHWQLTPVREFRAARLANGKPATSVDLFDLTLVEQFQIDPKDSPFRYIGRRNKAMNVLTHAHPGGEIGFKLFWPYDPEDRHAREMKVSFGASRWNPSAREWELVVDETMTDLESRPYPSAEAPTYQLVEARHPVPVAGIYRISIGIGANASSLASLNYDPLRKAYTGASPGFTFPDNFNGATQGPAWVYIPKGTPSLDLEVWDSGTNKTLTLHTLSPTGGQLIPKRTVDIGRRGTHIINLMPGEDGSLASISGSGFNFPHLYSIPQLWAKSPSALLIPREIAVADGLTPMGDQKAE